MRVVAAWIVLTFSTAAWSAPDRVVFLEASHPLLDDAAIAQAVSIYTRDLGLELEQRPGAPSEITAESLGAVLAESRARGPRLVFWYGLRDSRDVIVYAVANRNGQTTVDALRIASPEPAAVPRVIALKVRALLTGAAEYEPREQLPRPIEPPPPPPPPPPPSPPPTVKPVKTESPAAPPMVKPTTVTTPAKPRAPWLRLATSYVLTVPVDAAQLRHGVRVEAALPLPRRFELHLDVELSSMAQLAGAPGTATVFDVPLRIGARWLVGRRVAFGLGPLVTLHVVAAQGFAVDGARGGRVQTAAGLGGELDGRARITEHLSAELRFAAEAVLPDLHFLLRGVSVGSLGPAIFTVSVGLGFSAP